MTKGGVGWDYYRAGRSETGGLEQDVIDAPNSFMEFSRGAVRSDGACGEGVERVLDSSFNG